MRVDWLKKYQCQTAIRCPLKQSNACTVIALLIARKCSILQIRASVAQLKTFLTRSCYYGNQLHPAPHSLSVPEAMTLLGTRAPKELVSMLFQFNHPSDLTGAVQRLYSYWTHKHVNARHACAFMLFVTANQTVLLIADQEMVTLVDSHRHNTAGAVIARATHQELGKLTTFYFKMLSSTMRNPLTLAELALVYFQR